MPSAAGADDCHAAQRSDGGAAASSKQKKLLDSQPSTDERDLPRRLQYEQRKMALVSCAESNVMRKPRRHVNGEIAASCGRPVGSGNHTKQTLANNPSPKGYHPDQVRGQFELPQH